MNRFYAYVALAFFVSFASVSWSSWSTRGVPVVSTQSAVTIDPSPPGNKPPSLDQIRQDALQAATGFTLSSCDSTMKKNFIEALTAYFHAWQEKANCTRTFCGVEQKAATETFSTPLDRRIRTAFDDALSQPGISMADFPDALRYDMFRFGNVAPRYAKPTSCQPQTARRGRAS